jgi:hypothetical protein
MLLRTCKELWKECLLLACAQKLANFNDQEELISNVNDVDFISNINTNTAEKCVDSTTELLNKRKVDSIEYIDYNKNKDNIDKYNENNNEESYLNGIFNDIQLTYVFYAF